MRFNISSFSSSVLMTSIFTFMRDEKGVVMTLSARGLASTDSTEVRMMRSQADRFTGVIESPSLLRRLQAQTLPDATPPIGKIYPFSKMAVTFEPVMRF